MLDILAHAVNGDGTPLLLLNGGLMSYQAWEPVAVPLSASCRLVRCDFRGQLLSPGEPPPTLDGHADDLLRLMDHLCLDSAHVAGASFGALAGIALAARAPSRVRSLIAMTATEKVTREMSERGAELRAACKAAAEGGDGGRVLDLIAEATWSPEFRAANGEALAARRRVVSMLPRRWFANLEKLMVPLDDLDLTPALARITCPTLVIGGDGDRTFPVEHSRALAAGIRGAELVIIPGGSHGLVIEHAPKVIEMIETFMGKVERAGVRV